MKTDGIVVSISPNLVLEALFIDNSSDIWRGETRNHSEETHDASLLVQTAVQCLCEAWYT